MQLHMTVLHARCLQASFSFAQSLNCTGRDLLVPQVLTVQQTAEVLIQQHSDYTPVEDLPVEDLMNYIAKQHGFPTKPQVIVNGTTGLTKTDWLNFWNYTEDVNPYKKLRADYIPIGNFRQVEAGEQLLHDAS